MKKWWADMLVCPRDLGKLERIENHLACSEGHEYPIVDGIPVMLLKESSSTHEAHTRATFERVAASRESSDAASRDKQVNATDGIHEHVNRIVAGTCGQLYRPLVGKLSRYPIPEIRLPQASGGTLLDVGCNWGRWSIAAAKKGYRVLGIDPSLDAIIAAREVSSQLNVPCEYIVADARYLPFAPGSFDIVFSYSVIQHFSKENARQALQSIARVLKTSGTSLIQMPNKYGLRCLYNQAKRGFREPGEFQVRFWTIPELRESFTRAIGPSSLSVDGYFGLGVQRSDLDLLPRRYRLVVRSSEVLRRMSNRAGWMKYFADSLYVKSVPEVGARE